MIFKGKKKRTPRSLNLQIACTEKTYITANAKRRVKTVCYKQTATNKTGKANEVKKRGSDKDNIKANSKRNAQQKKKTIIQPQKMRKAYAPGSLRRFRHKSASTVHPPTARKRGRPLGSKNKLKENSGVLISSSNQPRTTRSARSNVSRSASTVRPPTTKKRGRPLGSKNKSKESSGILISSSNQRQIIYSARDNDNRIVTTDQPIAQEHDERELAPQPDGEKLIALTVKEVALLSPVTTDPGLFTSSLSVKGITRSSLFDPSIHKVYKVRYIKEEHDIQILEEKSSEDYLLKHFKIKDIRDVRKDSNDVTVAVVEWSGLRNPNVLSLVNTNDIPAEYRLLLIMRFAQSVTRLRTTVTMMNMQLEAAGRTYAALEVELQESSQERARLEEIVRQKREQIANQNLL